MANSVSLEGVCVDMLVCVYVCHYVWVNNVRILITIECVSATMILNGTRTESLNGMDSLQHQI